MEAPSHAKLSRQISEYVGCYRRLRSRLEVESQLFLAKLDQVALFLSRRLQVDFKSLLGQVGSAWQTKVTPGSNKGHCGPIYRDLYI